MIKEIWKPIIGYEGLYEVSNYGRVKSLERKVNSRYGIHRTINKKILKPNINSGGYCVVRIGGKTNSIHTLVYEAFIGKIPKGYYVNHIDENKANNAVWNLNLLTAKENSNWGTRNERIAKSLSKPISQYTLDGAFVNIFESAKEASKITKICRTSICSCCTGRRNKAGGYIWKYAA